MPKVVQNHQFPGEVPAEILARVDAKIRDCIRILSADMPDKVFPAPVVRYDLRGKTAGYAVGATIMRLNTDLLNDPRYVDDMIDDTVPHEYAHNFVAANYPYAQSHGYEWRRTMIFLGVAPERCHTYEVTSARTMKQYKYVCPCGVHWVSATTHNRIRKGERYYYCKDCNGRLVYERKVRLVK